MSVQTKQRPQENIVRAENTQEWPSPTALSPAPIIRHRWYLPIKAALDTIFALALFVLLLPFIGLMAALVKLTSRGPAFYRQTRVGQYGQRFDIIKLRTMVDNCESLTGPRWSIPGDPRVTWLGQVLRATHLDELPQLINVLRGEMSIIGPRPERPEFLPKLEKSLPGYRNRLLVRPGVTGLAQVQLPSDTDVESVRRKLACDLLYVQWANPWLDLGILFCTGLKVLGAPFWIAHKILGGPDASALHGAAKLAPEATFPRPRVAA